MAITKAKINRVGSGRLVIYTRSKDFNTTKIECSRNEIKEYLKHYEWVCFDWNGKRYTADIPWRSIILN
jgi:hypothetical protein